MITTSAVAGIIGAEGRQDLVQMKADHDGKETYLRLTFPVMGGQWQSVADRVLEQGLVDIYLRDERGGVQDLLRGWADRLDELEQRSML